ncbi:DUF3342 domain-containing protein [archaeon]|nr:MAG: DUF3342 domain-containing protein [archaeon]
MLLFHTLCCLCCKYTPLDIISPLQRFLGESSDNGYEDIDISVHCDVEIFEWLMQYIHETKYSTPLRIDKNILVSILISSDFLQMDELVEVCVEQVMVYGLSLYTYTYVCT